VVDREELTKWLRSFPQENVMASPAADLIDQQAARIAELEALLKKTDEGWEAEAGKRLKAEAERDEARRRFNDKDLCLHGQAPCEDLLAAERTAYNAGWIAGRDAAADAIEPTLAPSGNGIVVAALHRAADAIRALTPPEDKP
jgi:hypothetical protein